MKTENKGITRKEIIAFILMNVILITMNIVDTVQYRDVLSSTIPNFPFNLWKEIILESISLFVFSFIICFSLPIYKYIKTNNK